MMRQYELVERVARYNPHTDEQLLNKAYVYAMKAHGSQTRASGDPYFSHPLEVAAILTDLRLDDATIVAALLHDTIEDTDATRDEIDRLFGKEIGALVEGLTKIKKLDLVSKRAAQAENLRKLLLAIANDVRVLLVKLADRLHNMRTLEHVPPEKRARIAEETLDIYGPLAGRMGIHWMREELEDLAFRTLQPDAYQLISVQLEHRREQAAPVIAEIEAALRNKLAVAGINAQISGREKRPYSVWSKMERKAISFEQLSDIFGFRVLVEDIAACYATVGIVHTTWAMVPGRFKDYISTPKQNDYRSIHTTVLGPRHQRVELQVRTRTMHEIAEYGIAAHVLYKDAEADKEGKKTASRPARPNGGAEKGGFSAVDSNAYRWLRQLIEMLAEGDTPEEFLEHTKLQLFQDQVFCFTPKGRVISLPRGANVIDFAYAVHTDVGNNAIGCKINGRLEPLISPLNNGDEVEVLTAKNQTPPAAWESLVVTGKARQSIRRAARAQIRAQYAGLGRKMLERAFSRASRTYSDERLSAVLSRLGQSNAEDALAAVGRGEIPPADVIRAIYPDHRDESRSRDKAQVAEENRGEEGWFGLRRSMSLKFRWPGRGGRDAPAEETKTGPVDQRAIPIRGLHGELPVRFSPKGGAVPGDRIVGIMTPGEAITIYPIQSPELKNFDDQPERWLDVRWDIDADNPDRFPAMISVRALNEPGSLAEIAQIIGEQDANIDTVTMVMRAPDFTEMEIALEVWDLKHLNRIMALLKSASVVNAVRRVNG
ncbi:MAG: bifunctional (p)ppGpp synthetase/guanosine-3',5'-bis(diphosphate) 3'-pyrophosphohydrolase [Rhodobiaceae bacterium]|nr:bifunctional (p)ppGpp synthetase/guanosine-3',5'-bis(diphosphate) 3'-pyrophosphohydrolase [Rhodobiaceae bacterium]MCC0041637.1 bifunctional (p)ppGpp synthetase/guanosine-3',5'-bis(diphosphate) 3'-pyrophosphohydrolase [Rhodobiaceae bacterium]MCC0052614.1 bifunctional (p)ppGpp synthetase/guanosine-3',5'-bis(diphosphate) 3'-pyrophosphohydrolase [Rhodobiaceae bacterium]